MHFRTMVATLCLAATTAIAPAQAQSVAEAGLAVGVTVYGPEGNEVGKVEKVEGEIVTLNTGTNSAALTGASFAKGTKGPVIGYTKAQLDAAVEAAHQKKQSQLANALVEGAEVRSSDGSPVGKIKTPDANGSVVLEDGGRSFALERKLFSADDKGVILLITAQQLKDALSKSPASGA